MSEFSAAAFLALGDSRAAERVVAGRLIKTPPLRSALRAPWRHLALWAFSQSFVLAYSTSQRVWRRWSGRKRETSRDIPPRRAQRSD